MSNNEKSFKNEIEDEAKRKDEEIKKYKNIMDMLKSKTRPIRIPESTLVLLEKEADKQDLPLSKYINLLLILHLTSSMNSLLDGFKFNKND